MINFNKSGLQIFDNFQIDWRLPKWKKRIEQSSDNSTPMTVPSLNRFNVRGGNAVNGFIMIPENGPGGIMISGSSGDTSGSSDSKKDTFFDWLFGRSKKRRKLLEEKMKEVMQAPNFQVVQNPEPKIEMTAKEFFESVKNSAEELEIVNDRFASYEKALDHLKRTGQTAMQEKMEHELEIHRAESQLYAIGFRKVVTEENIVEFSKKSCKELSLDWIQNFTRLIPEKVLEAKEKCDSHYIFDNYVVLHYDPYRDGVLMTLAERAAEKDPILFGVIAGSNKLYYVADWIDEYCDLTFDKLVEKLGEDAVNANDLTAEIKITES